MKLNQKLISNLIFMNVYMLTEQRMKMGNVKNNDILNRIGIVCLILSN